MIARNAALQDVGVMASATLPTMGQPLTLRLDDLRAAITRALVAVESAIGAEVVLSEDYYWRIPSTKRSSSVESQPR